MVVGVYVWSDVCGSVICGSVCYRCIGSGTVVFVRYLGVGYRTDGPGVSGCSIALAASFWSIGPWLIVAVAWRHIVWVMVMSVGMLGLMLIWVV